MGKGKAIVTMNSIEKNTPGLVASTRSKEPLRRIPSMTWAIVVTVLSHCFISAEAATEKSLVNVSSIEELQSEMERSNRRIVVKPGNYLMGTRTFRLSGNNNSVELTGAYFSWLVGEVGRGRMSITGDGNTVRNGEFEDLYEDGTQTVTDFTAYNRDRSRLAKGG